MRPMQLLRTLLRRCNLSRYCWLHLSLLLRHNHIFLYYCCSCWCPFYLSTAEVGDGDTLLSWISQQEKDQTTNISKVFSTVSLSKASLRGHWRRFSGLQNLIPDLHIFDLIYWLIYLVIAIGVYQTTHFNFRVIYCCPTVDGQHLLFLWLILPFNTNRVYSWYLTFSISIHNHFYWFLINPFFLDANVASNFASEPFLLPTTNSKMSSYSLRAEGGSSTIFRSEKHFVNQ